ncbi:MAG: hypothetical protein AAB470_00530 [Patescibacteria group bacterium]
MGASRKIVFVIAAFAGMTQSDIMTKKLTYRILIDILILISILHGWWFIALPLAILGVWRYPYFIEIFAAGIIFDSIFGFDLKTNTLSFLGTVLSIVVYIGILILKRVVRK